MPRELEVGTRLPSHASSGVAAATGVAVVTGPYRRGGLGTRAARPGPRVQGNEARENVSWRRTLLQAAVEDVDDGKPARDYRDKWQ